VSATSDTRDREYAERLIRLQTARWKRLLHVQAPYGWNLRRLHPGVVLEIGCGIGRNLMHLRGNAVGLDHNRFAIQYARSRGLKAFTPEEFERSEYSVQETFDSLLLSHVAEHMHLGELVELLTKYRPVLKGGDRLIIVCPQERGFASDATHVESWTSRRFAVRLPKPDSALIGSFRSPFLALWADSSSTTSSSR
jgi:SAM-dependent methyltransferase